MAIKAIFLDIDGTLTNKDKIITPETKKALMTAQAHGIKLVIASGRPPGGLYKYGNQLDMQNNNGLFVCFNGASVVDCTTGETVVNTAMPKELAKQVIEHVKKFNVRPMVTHGPHMVVEDVYDCMIKDGDRTFNVLQYESRSNGYLLMEASKVEDYLDYPVNKILTAGDSAYLQEHYKEMAAPFEGQLSMMFTANFYYEYMPLGIDKGKSLDTAMTKLGIKREECIAFGDAENDISMLKYAGIGVAMANATDAVKAIADEITEDNNHDGIAVSLYKHIPELKEWMAE